MLHYIDIFLGQEWTVEPWITFGTVSGIILACLVVVSATRARSRIDASFWTEVSRGTC